MTLDTSHAAATVLLGNTKRGFAGTVHALVGANAASSLPAAGLESRLLELGFVEGARVEVLHEGLIGRDPIAVRVENITVAVRRREAMAVVVV